MTHRSPARGVAAPHLGWASAPTVTRAVTLAVLTFAPALEAQVRRPTRPAPSRPVVAAPVEPAGTSQFTVAGVPVILRRTLANDVVAVNTYLLGGTRLTGAARAGLEALYLQASEQGTERFPKAQLRETMAQLGTQIGVNATHEWTTFTLMATTGTLDGTWAVYADRLLRPRLEPAEVEFVRAQFLSGVRQRRDDPDTWLEYFADSIAFAGTPYGIDPVGSEASLGAISRDDLLEYRRTQLVKSRLLIAVVGNVTRTQIERLVREAFGALPAGTYRWTLPDTQPTGRPALGMDGRQLPTNYLTGYFAGPPATSPDYQALRVAAAVLSGQLFSEIRSRRNLTYAVGAPFKERAIAAAGLYVSTVAPDTVLALMQQELALLKRELITRDGLEQLVNQFLTDYYLDNETNLKQADGLARAYLYRGDWQLAEAFPDEIRRVTPEDVRRVAQRYLTGLRLAYIGDPRKLTRSRLSAF
ncbi:MAG: M16 family metallopeptidase [Gemmatimonadota bacterium]|jgi:zinc protease|nr:insulinase family protein [Gemmatimonadota bacterium]